MAKPIEDTGWQAPRIVDGKGIIDMPSAVEAKPCWLCKSFDKDTRKLIEYVTAHGMKAEPDGCYVLEEIAGDLPTRKQFRIDPRKTGYCRRLCSLAMDESTCPDWKQRGTREDMKGLIR